MKSKFALAAAVGLLALAPASAWAAADSFTLNLSAPTVVTGRSAVLHADGTIPVRDLFFSYWFSLSALRPSVTSTCPEDRWEAVQLAAAASGGEVKVRGVSVPRSATAGTEVTVGVTVARRGRTRTTAVSLYLSANAKRGTAEAGGAVLHPAGREGQQGVGERGGIRPPAAACLPRSPPGTRPSRTPRRRA